jgi:hypothetical protein
MRRALRPTDKTSGSVAIPRAISLKVRCMRTEWTVLSANRPPAGERVICFCRGAGTYVACWREGLDGAIEWISEYGIECGAPSHWTPLPHPPAQQVLLNERVATRIQECVYSALGQITEAARTLKTVPATRGPQETGGRKQIQESLVRAIAAVVSVLTAIGES